jgi:hypothetical protein
MRRVDSVTARPPLGTGGTPVKGRNRKPEKAFHTGWTIAKNRKNCYTLNYGNFQDGLFTAALCPSPAKQGAEIRRPGIFPELPVKRIRRNFFLLWGFLIIAAAYSQSGGRVMYVATKNAELKSSTGFFADTVITLQYGDQVTVVRENGRWTEVRPARRPSISGWILANSLTSKRIISSGSGTSASADELALAGKGFSEEVEQAYKGRGGPPAANYAEIDAMEALSVSRQDLYNFLVEGRLNTGEQQ